jgi:hypothetical protein
MYSFRQRGQMLCLVLILAAVGARQPAAEGARSQANTSWGRFALESRRIPLPVGVFLGWCGKEDVFFMKQGEHFRLYDAFGREQAALPGGRAYFTCDEKASNIVFVGSDSAFVENIRSSTKETLLSYQKGTSAFPKVSVSPDLKSVAYRNDGIQITYTAPRLKTLIPVDDNDDVHWKSDSSMFLTVINAQKIQVTDLRTSNSTVGELPRGFQLFISDPGLARWQGSGGAFISEGKELLLLMKPPDDGEAHYGTIFRCRVDPFECRPWIPEVHSSSMNERGSAAITRWIYRNRVPEPGPDVDLPDEYRIEVIDQSSKRTPIATFFRSRKFAFANASLSPSGKFLAITWEIIGPLCGERSCETGVIVPLESRGR